MGNEKTAAYYTGYHLFFQVAYDFGDSEVEFNHGFFGLGIVSAKALLASARTAAAKSILTTNAHKTVKTDFFTLPPIIVLNLRPQSYASSHPLR